MTVQELIDKLISLDRDKEVEIVGRYDYYEIVEVANEENKVYLEIDD